MLGPSGTFLDTRHRADLVPRLNLAIWFQRGTPGISTVLAGWWLHVAASGVYITPSLVPLASPHQLKTRHTLLVSLTRCFRLITMSITRLYNPFFDLDQFFDDASRPRVRSPFASYEESQGPRTLKPR